MRPTIRNIAEARRTFECERPFVAVPRAVRPAWSSSVAFLLLLFSIGTVTSQPILFGPEFDFLMGQSVGSFPIFFGGPGCGEFRNGGYQTWGVGPKIVLSERWIPLPRHTELGFRVGVNVASEEFVSEPPDQGRIFDGRTEALEDIDREYRFRSSLAAISFDLSVAYAIASPWGLSGTVHVGRRFDATFRETEELLGATSLRFADGASSRLVTDGPLITARPWSVGVSGALSRRLPLAHRVQFEPRLQVRFDLLSPVLEQGRISVSGGIGAALLFELTATDPPDTVLPDPLAIPPPSPDPTITDATPVTPAIPPAAAMPRAAIALMSVGSDGDLSDTLVIGVKLVEHRESISFHPSVFFERESAVIPARYVDAVIRENRSAIDTTATDSTILTDDPIETQRRGLALVGRRLRQNPQAIAHLVGRAAKDEPGELARDRAIAVRNFLVDSMGIERSRLKVETEREDAVADDGDGDRTVRIVLEPPAASAPFRTVRSERRFIPPRVLIAPRVSGPIDRWMITITSGSRRLAQYEGKERGGIDVNHIRWNLLDEEEDSARPPLVVTFDVVDRNGEQIIDHDSVPVLLRRPGGLALDDPRPDIEQYRFILTDDDLRLGLDNIADKLLDETSHEVVPGMRLVIAPNSIEEGYRADDEILWELARLTADRFRDRGMHDLDVTLLDVPNGPQIDTDTPEGRQLARGITLMVESERVQ